MPVVLCANFVTLLSCIAHPLANSHPVCSDFGLSKQLWEGDSYDGEPGHVAYTAQEILRGGPCTAASGIMTAGGVVAGLIVM